MSFDEVFDLTAEVIEICTRRVNEVTRHTRGRGEERCFETFETRHGGCDERNARIERRRAEGTNIIQRNASGAGTI